MSRNSFAYFNLSPLLLPFTSNSSHKLWGLLWWGLVFILAGFFFFFFLRQHHLGICLHAFNLVALRVSSSWVCCSWPVTLFLFWMYPGKSRQIQNFLLPKPISDLSGLVTTGSEQLLVCALAPWSSFHKYLQATRFILSAGLVWDGLVFGCCEPLN